eukprot:15481444-Alexandrium_andersonii.AAC.1
MIAGATERRGDWRGAGEGVRSTLSKPPRCLEHRLRAGHAARRPGQLLRALQQRVLGLDRPTPNA